jgi:uncharacterized MAPEG superfamily protein
MSLLIWVLFAALLLPYIAKAPVAIAMNKLGKYDNNHPRSQQTELTGYGARALAAHQNAFESLIIFTPALLLAIATNNTSTLVQQLAIAYIVSRLAYNVLYLANISTLRSIVWFVSLFCPLAIVWQCVS